MSVIINGDQTRAISLGQGPVSKATGTLSGTTFDLFTVAGGEVLITALWLKVNTSITTDGGTLAIESVQTVGGTQVFVKATDLGTTDTVASAVVGFVNTTADIPSFKIGGRADLNAVVSTGVIKALGAASINGAVTVYVTWIPLTSGASLVAA